MGHIKYGVEVNFIETTGDIYILLDNNDKNNISAHQSEQHIKCLYKQ